MTTYLELDLSGDVNVKEMDLAMSCNQFTCIKYHLDSIRAHEPGCDLPFGEYTVHVL